MAKTPKPNTRRISVDIGSIEKELAEFAQIASIPEDVWSQMPDSQKLLILAKRGIQATREALAKDAEQDG
ncbi:MAG: hypothetical protein F6K31_35160 [Symploca sp. SIO2G7]|nr:hypothetical protein [Symploca sp. SIO2G7]